jgi:hypothetical protein
LQKCEETGEESACNLEKIYEGLVEEERLSAKCKILGDQFLDSECYEYFNPSWK